MRQLSITFSPGMSQRSRNLREHVATQVYSGAGIVAIAGKIDVSPSKLTEKLAGVDSGGKPRALTVDELERYIDTTGDKSPIYYLVEKYLHDPEIAQQEAMAKLAQTLESLGPLMAAAGFEVKRKR